MRYRLVAPASDIATVRTVHETVPADSAAVEDCCGHLVAETPVLSREVAEEWLVFLKALELVATDGEGYYRVETSVEAEQLVVSFESSVFGVREIQAVLEDEQLPASDIFERVRSEFPDHDTDSDWEGYVERLLEWGVVFGLFTRTEDRYALC